MRYPFILAVALALAAPAGSGAFAADELQPGEWEIRSRIESVDVPGMPPQMTQAMKQAGARTMRHCLKAEDVKDAPSRLFASSEGKCRYDKFSMKGGRLDATMQCDGPNGGRMTGHMTGSYSPASYQMKSVMKATAGGGQPAMTMTSVGSGRRIGDCK